MERTGTARTVWRNEPTQWRDHDRSPQSASRSSSSASEAGRPVLQATGGPLADHPTNDHLCAQDFPCIRPAPPTPPVPRKSAPGIPAVLAYASHHPKSSGGEAQPPPRRAKPVGRVNGHTVDGKCNTNTHRLHLGPRTRMTGFRQVGPPAWQHPPRSQPPRVTFRSEF